MDQSKRAFNKNARGAKKNRTPHRNRQAHINDVQTLDNGAKLSVQHRPDKSGHMHAAIIVRAGSDFDPKEQSGLAHFLEHILPTPDTNHDFRALGGDIALSTGGDAVIIELYLPDEDDNADFLFETVNWILSNTTVDLDQIESERKRIINEIGMLLDNAEETTQIPAIAHNHGKRRTHLGSLGTKDIVREISEHDLIAFKKKHYCGRNISAYFSTPNKGALRTFKKRAEQALTEGIKAGQRAEFAQLAYEQIDKNLFNDRLSQHYFNIAVPYEPVDFKISLLADVIEKYLELRLEKLMIFGGPYTYATDVYVSEERSAFDKASQQGDGFVFFEGNVTPEDNFDILPIIANIIAEMATQPDQDDLETALSDMMDEFRGGYTAYMNGRSAAEIAADIANDGQIRSPKRTKDMLQSFTTADIIDFTRSNLLVNTPSIFSYGDNQDFGTGAELKSMIEERVITFDNNNAPQLKRGRSGPR